MKSKGSPHKPCNRKRQGQTSNSLRIIGGEHRSRRLTFADAEGLRPTTDKIRETLFNWLTVHLPQARCLDAFAGSGVLGFEALSRGAAEVIFLEKAKKAAEAIRENIDRLSMSSRATLHHTDSFQWLKHSQTAFDLIFLDPPFGQEGIQTALQHIEDNHLLSPEGRLYIEMERCDHWPISEHWSVLKSKTHGQVQFGLCGHKKII